MRNAWVLPATQPRRDRQATAARAFQHWDREGYRRPINLTAMCRFCPASTWVRDGAGSGVSASYCDLTTPERGSKAGALLSGYIHPIVDASPGRTAVAGRPRKVPPDGRCDVPAFTESPSGAYPADKHGTRGPPPATLAPDAHSRTRTLRLDPRSAVHVHSATAPPRADRGLHRRVDVPAGVRRGPQGVAPLLQSFRHCIRRPVRRPPVRH